MDLISTVDGLPFEMEIRRNCFSNTVIGSCKGEGFSPLEVTNLVMTDFNRQNLIVFLTSKDSDACASSTKEKIIKLRELRVVQRKEKCLIAEISKW